MLGRGLESLIPDKSKRVIPNDDSPAVAKVAADKGEAVFQIETDKIAVNPYQPRKIMDEQGLKDLVASIREHGIIQPLIVTKVEQETERGTEVGYQLVAGERRLQAARLLRLETVPAIIRSLLNEQQKLELALIENLQREDLNPIEAARAYAKLQDTFGLTQREIAVRVGKSRETIANAVRLLNLPSHIQEAITANRLSESQARVLLAISDPRQQEDLFQDIIHNNLSVRELKRRISRLRRRADTPGGVAQLAAAPPEGYPLPPPGLVDPEMVALQETLEELLGAPVRVHRSGETEVNITFSSAEDLRDLLKRMLPPEKHQRL